SGTGHAYSSGFRYLDYADIVRISYPSDLLLIERLEYGDAIGIPVALEVSGEGTLPAADERFPTRFRALVAEVNHRRDVIQRIEKYDIGAINAGMDALRLQQRALTRAHKSRSQAVEARLHAIQDALTALQAKY